MAFFKFRFPGQSTPAEAVTPGPNENIEVVRRRARHRLIGAVVLVLVAVVGFPLLFDTQPRPVAVGTPIVIPDRQNTAPLASQAPVPESQAPAKPLLAPAKALPPQAGLDPREQVVKPETATEKPTAALEKANPPTIAPVAPQVVAPALPVAKPQTKAPAPEKADKPSPVAKPKDDGLKAKALLEGKTVEAAGDRMVIQVGAFSDPAKVREVRRKLEQAGLKTYTQVVTNDGKSTTRIRVGPFASRAEADKVVARIRKLDLPAAVLKI